MKLYLHPVVLFSVIVMSLLAFQSNAKTRDLAIKKERVVDFLFLTLKEDGRQYQRAYFEDIGPSGRKLGYEAPTFFYIERKPISGMYFPKLLAVGSWPGDWQARQSLFNELLVLAPEIRSRRLDIWSTFNMINYEVKQDVDIAFDPQSVYVFGAYWSQEQPYYDELLQAIQSAGGKVEMSSSEVNSMFGYKRAPDFSVLSKWPNQKAFEQFYSAIKQKQEGKVEYSSEFYLEIDKADS